MNEAVIFVYGLVVFAIVAGACWMIVWGIIEEGRDRESLDAGPGAREPTAGTETVTAADGETLRTGKPTT